MKSATKNNSKYKKLPIPCKITLFSAIAGIIAGYVSGHLLKENLYSPLITIYNETINNIPGLDIDKSDIFLLAARKNLKLFIFLYLFSITNLWTYYYCAFSFYTGFTNGLLLSFNIILHGISGILRFLCYICPQILLFIPLYLIIIAHCDSFHNEFISYTSGLKYENTYIRPSKQKKGKLALQQFPFIIFCLLVIAAGSFIESHFNLPLIIWYMGHMV